MSCHKCLFKQCPLSISILILKYFAVLSAVIIDIFNIQQGDNCKNFVDTFSVSGSYSSSSVRVPSRQFIFRYLSLLFSAQQTFSDLTFFHLIYAKWRICFQFLRLHSCIPQKDQHATKTHFACFQMTH